MRRYQIYMKRNFFPNESFELYNVGLIQGLVYGMCTIPCNTTKWDCERFDNFVLFTVDCTDEHLKKFMETVESIYPGLCHYGEQES